MKEEMLKLKNDLKELAKELRDVKSKRNESFRNGEIGKAGKFQYSVLNLKHEFRHKHIAYCMSRGREYTQIEPKVREGNEVDWNYINKLIIPKESEGVA